MEKFKDEKKHVMLFFKKMINKCILFIILMEVEL